MDVRWIDAPPPSPLAALGHGAVRPGAPAGGAVVKYGGVLGSKMLEHQRQTHALLERVRVLEGEKRDLASRLEAVEVEAFAMREELLSTRAAKDGAEARAAEVEAALASERTAAAQAQARAAAEAAELRAAADAARADQAAARAETDAARRELRELLERTDGGSRGLLQHVDDAKRAVNALRVTAGELEARAGQAETARERSERKVELLLKQKGYLFEQMQRLQNHLGLVEEGGGAGEGAAAAPRTPRAGAERAVRCAGIRTPPSAVAGRGKERRVVTPPTVTVTIEARRRDAVEKARAKQGGARDGGDAAKLLRYDLYGSDPLGRLGDSSDSD